MVMEVSPSVYEHAAKIINRTPWEVSRNGELIYQAHAAAYEFYQQTPIMPGIDIYNLEPEAYGAVIEEPVSHNIPAIRHHPLSSAAELVPGSSVVSRACRRGTRISWCPVMGSALPPPRSGRRRTFSAGR